MSRARGRKLPGAEFTWQTEPGAEPDTAPTPLYPKYDVPRARPLNPREQAQVDLYRVLRERFHEGPDYSVLETATSSAKRGDKNRAQFDPFHGMPSYSGRYQKKRRTAPDLRRRQFVLRYFPKELWQIIEPSFRPDASLDGFTKRPGLKRGFEEDEEAEEVNKRRRAVEDEDEEEGNENEDENRELLEEDEEQEQEEIVDDDFSEDDDEMGGDYNAEQYFDGGDDEFGDDNFMDGVGGAGGDEDTY